ncbi:MAG: hypothetical protein ABJA80_13945 [bacterium]
MPLDLALSTNTPTAALELRQAQPLGDQRHVAAFLVVRSGVFAAALPFVFTSRALASFTEALDTVARSRTGEAELSGRDGGNIVRFEVNAGGALHITGTLADPDDDTQRLQFAFGVPWEGVVAFAGVVRELIDLNA